MNKLRVKGRAIHGILLFNKPEGMSSNAALQMVKTLYEARKAGHTGSLDPLASGMLPICFGEATKFSQFLLEADKHYQVTAQLGVTTTTGDREGEIVSEKPVPALNEQIIKKLFSEFTGNIQQIPSMYSAIKHNGQPLYKLARQGIEIERESRPVTIYSLTLLGFTENSFEFTVSCSKGTYIRTLVEDMGNALGCGGHVAKLFRSGAGPYKAESMQTLLHLQTLSEAKDFKTLDSYLLPVDTAIQTWPELKLSEAAIYYLKQGQPIIASYAPSSGWVRLFRQSGEFFGVGEILDDGRVAPRRLVQL